MTGAPLPGPRVYLLVLLALLGFTTLTILIAYLDLGPLGTPVALAIAGVKALLVVLFFMHMKDSPGIIWLAGLAGFFWFGILIVLTMSDIATRGLLPIAGK